MKKVLVTIIAILSLGNTLEAKADFYNSPANLMSPTNLILNPVNQWYPANIYHEDSNTNTQRDRITRRQQRKYDICVKYGGGYACKMYLK